MTPVFSLTTKLAPLSSSSNHLSAHSLAHADGWTACYTWETTSISEKDVAYLPSRCAVWVIQSGEWCINIPCIHPHAAVQHWEGLEELALEQPHSRLLFALGTRSVWACKHTTCLHKGIGITTHSAFSHRPSIGEPNPRLLRGFYLNRESREFDPSDGQTSVVPCFQEWMVSARLLWAISSHDSQKSLEALLPMKGVNNTWHSFWAFVLSNWFCPWMSVNLKKSLFFFFFPLKTFPVKTDLTASLLHWKYKIYSLYSKYDSAETGLSQTFSVRCCAKRNAHVCIAGWKG